MFKLFGFTVICGPKGIVFLRQNPRVVTFGAVFNPRGYRLSFKRTTDNVGVVQIGPFYAVAQLIGR